MANLVLQLLSNDVFLSTGLGTLIAIPAIAKQYLPWIPPSNAHNPAQALDLTMDAPNVLKQATTTINAISTVYIKSVSFITQTTHFGIERTTTMHTIAPPLSATQTNATVRKIPVTHTYNDSMLGPDSIAFWLITTAVVAFCLGSWFATLHCHKAQTQVAEPQRKETKTGQKVNATIGTQTKDDKMRKTMPSSKLDLATADTQAKPEPKVIRQDTENFRNQLHALRSKLATQRKALRQHEANRPCLRRVTKTAIAALESRRLMQSALTTSETKIRDLNEHIEILQEMNERGQIHKQGEGGLD